MLTLTDDEKAMLDGRHGKARQKAMDLLVRYAEALGAERFVDTRNVAGVPGSANPFLQHYYKDKDADGRDAIFSYFDLDSDELVEVPNARRPHLSPAGRRRSAALADARREGGSRSRNYQEREAFAARQGRHILKTCTPYLAGNRAGDGRALRVDGIVGGDLRELGARCAHQHRGAREHERGDADGQDP